MPDAAGSSTARGPDVTIVTACTTNYVWGAWLLVASLRRYGVRHRIHVLERDFGAAERRLIEQFADVDVLPLAKDDQRTLTVRKPESLLTASTDWVAWLDADCMAAGDIGGLLAPPSPGMMMVRVRGPDENAMVWRGIYATRDRRGGLPASVRERWRADVGDAAVPRHETTVVANAIVFHRSHRPFIELWDRQLRKVLPDTLGTVTDAAVPAYRMTDESVLSSLIAFSSLAPPLAEYRLDAEPDRMLVHFGQNPKPWKRWRWRAWRYFDEVQGAIHWAREAGYAHPELTWSLRRRWRLLSWSLAFGEHLGEAARPIAGGAARP